MRLLIVPSIRSRRAVSDGGPLLSAAYDLICFIMFFGQVCIEDGSSMDRGWIDDGSRMDRGWIEDGSRMDRGWIKDG